MTTVKHIVNSEEDKQELLDSLGISYEVVSEGEQE